MAPMAALKGRRTSWPVYLSITAVIGCLSLFACVNRQAAIPDIEELIRRAGAREALDGLYSNEHNWTAFLSQVGAGQRRALATAAQLMTVADAGAAEQLELAAGEALKSEPAKVFEVCPPFIVAGVCGAPDIDDPRFDSAERAVAEIKARQKSVLTIQRHDFEKNREECLQALADAIPKVKAFYGK